MSLINVDLMRYLYLRGFVMKVLHLDNVNICFTVINKVAAYQHFLILQLVLRNKIFYMRYYM